MWSGFPRRSSITAHASRRLLTLHLKTCLLFTLFTTILIREVKVLVILRLKHFLGDELDAEAFLEEK
jgi:hypothetical protein